MPSSLLLLLDDVASMLDDVSALTKVAAKKTAGVLGDDLALNANQVAGVLPARELAVVWRVACGSAVNKLVLVPAALALSWLAPWAVTPLLMAGGAYLCYEGAEKILHRLLHRPHAGRDARSPETRAAGHGESHGDHQASERDRVAGAVRTDFILPAEIVVITLGIVSGRPFVAQLAVLLAISAAMTIGVYGLVAVIVKLDDAGILLASRPERWLASIGRGILATAPWLMRGLSIAGTAAMFLVGGGIMSHGMPVMHRMLHDAAARLVGTGPGSSPWIGPLSAAADAAVGLAVGLSLAGVMLVGQRWTPFGSPSRGRTS
ncbi:MAG: DUF808 domain-containing protein [Planctomycetota bacterium]